MRHPFVVRLLHLATLAGVVAQLFTSESMKTPRPGRVATGWQLGNFVVHDRVGLVLLGVVVAFALRLAAMRRRGGWRRFAPWADPDGRTRLAREAADLLRRPWTAAQRLVGTARTVQGAGLALLAFLGTSGWAMRGPLERGERLVGALHWLKEAHETAGSLLWAWLGLHLALSLVPLLAGRASALDIFRFGSADRRRESAPRPS